MSGRYKILFNYGSIAGLVAFAWAVLIYLFGFSPLGVATFSEFWIPILIVFLSIKANAKAALPENGYPFSRAFFDGITTGILTGFLKGMLLFVFMKVLASDIPDQYYAEQERLIAFLERNSQGQNIANIEQLKAAIEQDKKVGFGGYRVVFGEINKYFYFAIPFSILAAFIYKKPFVKNDNQ